MDIEDLRNRIERSLTKLDRPFIVINAAASLDGKIAGGGGGRLDISTEEDFKRVHRLRNEVDGILVGINTIINDDPRLLVKEKYLRAPARQPVRIVLDSRGRTPKHSRVFSGESKVMIATIVDNEESLEWVEREHGGEAVGVKEDVEGRVDTDELFGLLRSRNIRSVLVEGGSTVISHFLRRDQYDVFSIFFRNFIIGGADAPSVVGGKAALDIASVVSLPDPVITVMNGGFLITYYNENPR